MSCHAIAQLAVCWYAPRNESRIAGPIDHRRAFKQRRGIWPRGGAGRGGRCDLEEHLELQNAGATVGAAKVIPAR